MLPHEVQLKLDRARGHLAELEVGCKAFLDDNPVRFHPRMDEMTGQQQFVVTNVAPVPLDLGLPLGDALHNARSALDLLACRLVAHEGGTGDKASFPIAAPDATCDPQTGEPKDWGKRVRSALPGAERARTAIRDLRPFRGGDELLVALHALDVADKHRILLPVVARMGHTVVDLRAPRSGFVRPTFMYIEEGVVLYTVPSGPVAQTEMLAIVPLGLELAFSPQQTVLLKFADQPAPLASSTALLIDHAEHVAIELAHHLL